MEGRASGWAAAAFALAVGVLSWPAVRWAWGMWRSDPLYSHGPLVVLVSLVIAWRAHARGTGEGDVRLSAWPLSLVVGGLAAMAWALVRQAFYLSLLTALPVAVGAIWFLYGNDALRRYAFPIGYLLFAMPLPLAERLSVPLQRWAVGASTALARLLGVPASYEGSRVLLPTCELTVGAPCSGVRSLVALLALATLMAYLLAGRWWARVALVVAAAPLALAVNAARVLALLLIAARWGREAALGMWHEWSGPLFFGLEVASLIAVGRWLGCRGVRGDI